MAEVAAEIFERDVERHAGAGARARRAGSRRGACLRVTWVQPEDLVGHELRQAREEGKDVDAIEARWLGAGGRRRRPAAPRRSPSRRSCGRSRSSCSTSSPRCRGRWPRDEPDGFEEILAAADPAPAARRSTSPSGSRAPGSAAPPAACSASRSRTSRARESARSREATGNWPVAGWFTAAGPPRGGLGALAVEPRAAARRASPRTSTASPRTTTSTSRCSASRCSSAAARGFDALDVAKIWLDFLPPGRIFTAERVAMRNLLEAYLPPRDGDAPQPVPRVDRRAAARRRLRLGRAPAIRCAAARMAWEDARVSHTANGVYAAMFMAAAHAASLVGRRRRRRARTRASRSSRRAAGSPRRSATAREPRGRARVGGGRRRALRALRRLPLGARDQQHGARRRGALRVRRRLRRRRSAAVVQGGLDTDTNGAAVGSILGALAGAGGIEERWTAPLGDRFASSLPGFDGITIDELVRAHARGRRCAAARVSIALEAPRDPLVAAADRPADAPCRSTGRRSRRARRRRRSSPRPTTPPTGPPGARRSTRWRDEARGADRLRRRRLRAPELAWTQRCFSVALVWLWDELLYDHEAARFTPERFCAEAEREFGGFDGIVLWHAYPVIGIDERNQFDWYRDVPGLARARRRAAGARRARLRRLQPVGRRHAARAGRRRRGASPSSCASSAPTASSSTR